MKKQNTDQLIARIAALEKRVETLSSEMGRISSLIDLGKEPEVIAALRYFQRIHWPEGGNLAEITAMVLRMALMHPAHVSRWLKQVGRYAYIEGFDGTGDVMKLISRTIASRREYTPRRSKTSGGSK